MWFSIAMLNYQRVKHLDYKTSKTVNIFQWMKRGHRFNWKMLSEKMTINPWVWTLKQTRNGLLGKTCLADGNMLQSIPDHDHIEAILRGVASGRPFGHSAGVQIPVLQNLVFLSKKNRGMFQRGPWWYPDPRESGYHEKYVEYDDYPHPWANRLQRSFAKPPNYSCKGMWYGKRISKVMISRLRPLYNVHMTDYTKVTLLNHLNHQMQGYFCSLCKTFWEASSHHDHVPLGNFIRSSGSPFKDYDGYPLVI